MSTTPPRQVVFDSTPEIYATDSQGSFNFPLAVAGKTFLGTSSYDEVRFVFSIWHPSGQRTIDLDRAYVELRASFDPEEENLPASRFAWSSSLDGALGTDNNFSRKASELSPGIHVVTVTVTDGQGAQATDTATIRIASEAAGPLSDLAVSITDAADPVAPGSTATYTVTAESNGLEPASDVSVEFSATLDPEGAAGPGPATILSAVFAWLEREAAARLRLHVG